MNNYKPTLPHPYIYIYIYNFIHIYKLTSTKVITE